MRRDGAVDGVRHMLLVERYLGAVTPERVARLAVDTRAAASNVAAQGLAVAYLGSVAIPLEETCFCLFAAESSAAVEHVNAMLVTPAVQTVSALWTGGGLGTPVDATRAEKRRGAGRRSAA